MSNTKVTFSAQDDGSIQSTMDRLRGSASALAREMVQDASSRLDTGREIVSNIEDQIRAIERRNRLDKASGRLELKESFDSKEIDQDQYKKKLNTLNTDSQQDDMQIRLLRDLIQTIIETSEDEIRANADNLDDAVSNEDRDSQDPLVQLRNKLILDQQTDDQDDKGSNNNIAAAANFGVQQAQRAVLSKNELYAIASATLAIPVVGGAISGLLNKSFSGAEALQQSRGDLNALTDDRVGTLGGGAARYGMNVSEFMQISKQLALSRGQVGSDLEQETYDAVSLRKGLGLSDQSLNQTLRSTRNDEDGSLLNSVGLLLKNLNENGVATSDFALVEEYLQIANQLAGDQNMKLDSIDTGINADIVGNFSGLGGSFKDPQVLSSVIGTINQQLQNPQSQYAQALQFSVLSQQNPDASRIDLMKMQEKGIAQPGLLKGMFDTYSNISGDNQDFFTEQIKASFPQLSFSQAEKLVKSYNDGSLDLDFQSGDLGNEDNFRDTLQKRSADSTGYIQRQTSEIDNILAIKGDELSMKVGQLVESMGGVEGVVGTLMDTGIKLTEAINGAVSLFSSTKIPTVIASNKIFTSE